MTHWGNHSNAEDGVLWNKIYFLQGNQKKNGKCTSAKEDQGFRLWLSCQEHQLLDTGGESVIRIWCSEDFPVIKDQIFDSLFSTDCRWQRVTSQRSARRVREVWWIRPTSWRSSILLFLQGLYIISDRYFTVLLRPEDRVNKLSEQLANTEGKIGDLKILLIA